MLHSKIFTLWLDEVMQNSKNSRSGAVNYISNKINFDSRNVFKDNCISCSPHFHALVLCNPFLDGHDKKKWNEENQLGFHMLQTSIY